MLPAISLLTKISNHLELIRPDAKLQQQDERQVRSTAVHRSTQPCTGVLVKRQAVSLSKIGVQSDSHAKTTLLNVLGSCQPCLSRQGRLCALVLTASPACVPDGDELWCYLFAV